MNGQQDLAVFPGSLTGLIRSTTEQAKKKEIESWLLKNAASFGFLSRQALLILCHLLTLMKLLQTAEDQGEKKKKKGNLPEEKLRTQLCVLSSICNSAIPRENIETVKSSHANDHIQSLI